jgi:hypothetical protein
MNRHHDNGGYLNRDKRPETPPSPIVGSEEISKNAIDIKAMIDQAFLDSPSGNNPSTALIQLIKPLIASEAVLKDPDLQSYKKADARVPLEIQRGLDMGEEEEKKTKFIELALNGAVESLQEDLKAGKKAEEARDKCNSRGIRPGGR